MRSIGGDIKSGPGAIMRLEISFELPERHVLLGEEVAPGWVLSSGVVGIGVPRESGMSLALTTSQVMPRINARRGSFEGNYVSNLSSIDVFIEISKETLQQHTKRDKTRQITCKKVFINFRTYLSGSLASWYLHIL